jgi:DNA ligase-1
MHRRRKHGIEKAMEDYPIALFVFDLLYVNGEDLTHKPYLDRRKALKKVLKENETMKLATTEIISSADELEKIFEISIEKGLEGLVCKSIASDSLYKAGSRGWLWIKYKRDYKSEMIEPADLVIVGGFYGRGRRKATYGALLLAAYDDKTDMFRTITKCGSGFKDVDLASFIKKLKPYAIKHKHPRVDSKLKPDQWFTPGLVIEVIGAEMTLSPIHTAAWGKIRKDSGLAIRFPRFTGKWRVEKSPEDATTTKELIEMYKAQLKKIKK